MKKVIVALLLVMILVMSLASCGNKQVFDITYKFNYAYVTWPDGTSEKLEISSWTDYEDGDSIQITLKNDGSTYLFHASDCVLGTK